MNEPWNYNPVLNKCRTPISLINIANCGGYNFSSLVEVYGESKSGKSTFCYQTASHVLSDYGDDARVVILTSEGVVNRPRLKMTFGLDVLTDPRIIVEPVFTIEAANDAIIRWSTRATQDHKYTAIIWDSVKATSFARAKEVLDKSMADNKQSTGDDGSPAPGESPGRRVAVRSLTEPMAKAQVLGWCLNNALHAIYMQPVIIYLINQVTTKVDRFQNITIDSGGGFSLRHNVEERLFFKYIKAVGGDKKDSLFKTGTMSSATVKKSRTIPCFQDIPVLIDDTSGGRIQENDEVPLVANRLGVLVSKSGGWNSIAEDYWYSGIPDEFKKNKTTAAIVRDPEYMQALCQAIKLKLRREFKLVDFMWSEVEQIANQPSAVQVEKPVKGKKASST